MTAPATSPETVTFAQALPVWLRIGVLSFGGPAGQIALMHRELVEDRGWLGETRFLHALNFCMLLPGPEAMQLATYAGWMMHGVRGGLAAGLLFVLPGASVVLALSTAYALFGDAAAVETLFLGVKAAVLAIVLEALLRVSRRALATAADRWIAVLAFLAITALGAPFPLIVLVAALVGVWRAPRAPLGASTDVEAYAPVPPRRTLTTIAAWLSLWLAPLALLTLALGTDHVLSRVAWFFSALAVVSFGGAYAVLAWMAQRAVEVEGWLSAGEMLDGLGLAETTPGPLILVTEFVGFLAGFGAGGVPLGLAAAGVTLWATFAPCFLWIFAGAPYVERLRAAPRFAGAIATVTAAVVGVIGYLALWFGLRVLFVEVGELRLGPLALDVPDPTSLDWRAALIFALAALALLRLHLGVVPTLCLAALLGFLLSV